MSNKFRTGLLLICLGFLVILVDQAVKVATDTLLPSAGADQRFYPYGGIGVFYDFLGIQFSIHHVVNYGAAWGMLADYQHILLIARILLIGGMVCYAAFINKDSRWSLPLTLIISGAIGNVLDYFLYGHVVDMFHFIFWGYSYPVFNIADSAVCIGVFWLGAVIAFGRDKETRYG